MLPEEPRNALSAVAFNFGEFTFSGIIWSVINH